MKFHICLERDKDQGSLSRKLTGSMPMNGLVEKGASWVKMDFNTTKVFSFGAGEIHQPLDNSNLRMRCTSDGVNNCLDCTSDGIENGPAEMC